MYQNLLGIGTWCWPDFWTINSMEHIPWTYSDFTGVEKFLISRALYNRRLRYGDPYHWLWLQEWSLYLKQTNDWGRMISPPFTNQVVELCSLQDLKKFSTYKKKHKKKTTGENNTCPPPKTFPNLGSAANVRWLLPFHSLKPDSFAPVDVIFWDRSFMCCFDAWS